MATLSIILLMITQTGFAQNLNVYFDSGIDAVSSTERKKVEKLADEFIISGKNIVRITGFADSIGTTGSNLDLSERRAKAIKNILVERGIEETNIFLSSEGEKKSASNQLKENRRVEISGMKGIVPANKILSQMEPSTQRFVFQGSHDCTIKGEQGTTVEIPKDIFVDMNGNPVKGNVEFELKEYYTTSDFIMGGLTTKSGEHIINSGGTIYVRALYEGKEVALAPDKQLKIGFTSEYDNDMRAFYGAKQPDGFLNWLVDSRSTRKKVGNNFKAVKQDTVMLMGIDSKDMERIHYFDDAHANVRRLTQEEANTFKMMKPVSNTLYISKLGWINCDKFMKDPDAVDTDVIVNVKCSGATKWSSVYLVFEDFFSVINLSPLKVNGGIINSSYAVNGMRMPKNVKATIIVVNSNENGIFFAQKTLNLSDLNNIDLELKSMCAEQVKEELMCLNKKD